MSKAYLESLKRKVLSEIDDIFSDKSVSREVTKDMLE